MDLMALRATAPDLADKTHYEKITIFGWWLHTHGKKPAFAAADIGRCYDALHYSRPSSFGAYFQSLVRRKELLRINSGYKLESKVRDRLDGAYGRSQRVTKINGILSGLADQIPDLAEHAYYQEALICYNHGAFRAAIVMTWNVAFSHLCSHVLAKHCADFNARWQISHPGMHKNKGRIVATIDDINDALKESEVLAICRDAGIITKNVYNLLHAALNRRNAAAHPSTVVIDQFQVDAHISDLIVNVVKKLS